jgi:hypothetical protein
MMSYDIKRAATVFKTGYMEGMGWWIATFTSIEYIEIIFWGVKMVVRFE